MSAREDLWHSSMFYCCLAVANTWTYAASNFGVLACTLSKYSSIYCFRHGSFAIARILSGPALTWLILLTPKASAQATKPSQVCTVTGG